MNDESLKGHMILYYDAGIVMTKLPFEMLEISAAEGVSFIEDTTQKNRFWFSETFKESLLVQNGQVCILMVSPSVIAMTRRFCRCFVCVIRFLQLILI